MAAGLICNNNYNVAQHLFRNFSAHYFCQNADFLVPDLFNQVRYIIQQMHVIRAHAFYIHVL